MKRFLKYLFGIVIGLVVLAVLLVAGIFIAINVSPRPMAWLTKRQFAGGIGIAPVTPAEYVTLSPTVRVEKDIEYPRGLR